MGRNVRIPKEKLLQTGLKMLIRDGYSSINITSLAKEAGCSTQPVAWHFGNMESFRTELAGYALEYVNSKMSRGSDNPLNDFLKNGSVYVDMAFDEPKLVRFLQLDEGGCRSSKGLGFLFEDKSNAVLAERIAEKYSFDIPTARRLMQSAVIYTQGLVSLISSGIVKCTREEAKRLLMDFGITFLIGVGVPKDKAERAFD
ncbi:MAG: TetR/AcrR family transcriptional regulator [Huintestinicola sp.]|uniref:TetR/AcrR family transcriptional regulator n=1 Tax=Huintestinicola sp. TaxID=2981661 RepID=UPI003F003CCD